MSYVTLTFFTLADICTLLPKTLLLLDGALCNQPALLND